jgi:nucleoside-diphosphate-sugar epimerase
VLPDLVQKILSGQYPLELLGSPEATRTFIHVRDVAAGFVKVLESEKAVNQDYNLGNENEIKIIDLAKLLWKLCERKEPFKAVWSGEVTDTSVRRSLSAAKLRKLGWKPTVSLEKGAKEVVEWLKNSNVENQNSKPQIKS